MGVCGDGALALVDDGVESGNGPLAGIALGCVGGCVDCDCSVDGTESLAVVERACSDVGAADTAGEVDRGFDVVAVFASAHLSTSQSGHVVQQPKKLAGMLNHAMLCTASKSAPRSAGHPLPASW